MHAGAPRGEGERGRKASAGQLQIPGHRANSYDTDAKAISIPFTSDLAATSEELEALGANQPVASQRCRTGLQMLAECTESTPINNSCTCEASIWLRSHMTSTADRCAAATRTHSCTHAGRLWWRSVRACRSMQRTVGMDKLQRLGSQAHSGSRLALHSVCRTAVLERTAHTGQAGMPHRAGGAVTAICRACMTWKERTVGVSGCRHSVMVCRWMGCRPAATAKTYMSEATSDSCVPWRLAAARLMRRRLIAAPGGRSRRRRPRQREVSHPEAEY